MHPIMVLFTTSLLFNIGTVLSLQHRKALPLCIERIKFLKVLHGNWIQVNITRTSARFDLTEQEVIE